MHVVWSDGSVRTLQVFIPDLFREVAQDGVRDVERLSARPGARGYAVAGVTLGDEVELRHGDVAVNGDRMNSCGLGCLEWTRRRIAV